LSSCINYVEAISDLIINETEILVKLGVDDPAARQRFNEVLSDAVEGAQERFALASEDVARLEASDSAEVKEMGEVLGSLGRILAATKGSVETATALVAVTDKGVAALGAVKERLPEVQGMNVPSTLVMCLAHLLETSIKETQKVPADVAAQWQARLDALRHSLGVAHEAELSRLREDCEAEARQQLRRQAEASHETLTARLESLREQLEAKAGVQLSEEAAKLRAAHTRDVAGVKGRLEGLLGALRGRAEEQRAARAGHQLWVACENLKGAVEGERVEAGHLLPLKNYLTVVGLSVQGDKVVGSLMDSLDETTLDRGVYTQQALRHRFERVASVARGVASVPEGGASILRYLLGQVHALLLARPQSADLNDEPVDIHALTQYDVIDRAQARVSAGDLMGALRWMSQLSGESRNVAADWCAEARRSLAAAQLADVLMAYAVSQVAEACQETC